MIWHYSMNFFNPSRRRHCGVLVAVFVRPRTDAASATGWCGERFLFFWFPPNFEYKMEVKYHRSDGFPENDIWTF